MTKAHSLDFCCPDLQALLWHGLLLASDSNGQNIEDGLEDGEAVGTSPVLVFSEDGAVG